MEENRKQEPKAMDGQTERRYVVGVDLGGTKIFAAVFDSNLEIVGKAKRSTKAKRGVSQVLDRIAQTVLDAVDESDLSLDEVIAVGIGAPGAMDPQRGVVLFAPNLHWRDVSLTKELEKRLGLPVYADNDCNVQVLGIHAKELDGRPQNLVGIFIGTGIGAGLILNGQLYHGHTRTAGEIGHMVLQIDGPKCSCGNRGCFEALASRTAIMERIKAEVKNGVPTLLHELTGGDLDKIRSGDLKKAVKKGDALAKRIIKETAVYIGIAVANIINLLNPEYVVLGGGVIEALEDRMMKTIEETARDYAMEGAAEGVKIQASALGDRAGIVGAAVLARQKLGEIQNVSFEENPR